MQNYYDYVYFKNLNLNTSHLKDSCRKMRTIIKNEIPYNDLVSYADDNAPSTTQKYANYNLLLYPFDGFYELYNEIKIMFNEIKQNSEYYYIQCWLNYYEPGQFVDWHWHWPDGFNSWHGFYCLDVENSKTTYKINELQFDVVGKNNMLVIGKCENDKHRTYPQTTSRTTIAFDIVSRNYLKKQPLIKNHWIPI